MPLDDSDKARVRAYQAHLNRVGPAGRQDFVDAARRSEDWPPRGYLAAHAGKWGRGLLGPQYAQLAYDIKNAAGVHVYAYIHPIWHNRGLAFVDLERDSIVLFDCAETLNRDLFSPPNGAARWIRNHVHMGTHWRLRDTER
jgi:hypothetical protein